MTESSSETEAMCEFAATMEFDDIPQSVVSHAKLMILDTIGVTVAGTETEAASIAKNLFNSPLTGSRSARVPGSAVSARETDAAFLTGIRSHALDFDDIHPHLGGHPSAPVISALLPLVDTNNASGEGFLRAYILGTEVEITLGNVLNPGHYERGWHPTAILGVIGATVAVGDLLHLSQTERRRSLGIAASQAAGIKGNFGTMTKPFHVGAAARNAIEAATLASNGFTANESILELDFGGFCDLFQGEPPYAFDSHLSDLGDPFSIVTPKTGFKPYPCCGSIHAAIDAALKLRADENCDVDSVSEINIREHPRRLGHTNNPAPKTTLDAKFSAQYCVLVALLEGDIWMNHFEVETIAEYTKHPLFENISIEPDPEGFADREWGAQVEIITSNGDHYSIEIDSPTGSADNPMHRDELIDKYSRCASTVLPSDRVSESIDVVLSLETLDGMSTLLDIITT